MATCGECGRTYDTSECMYCWGFKKGMEINQANYDAQYGDRRSSGSTGGGCALVVLAAAALPILIAAAGAAAAIHLA